MSDVILYAALKSNQKLNTELLELCASGSNISFYQGPQTAGYPYTTTGTTTSDTCPQIVIDWQTFLTPLVEVNQSNGFKVCDTTSEKRCNACCEWCVPPGVSRAQIQIWGAGGGTSSNCCCGGAPFGPSGAYMVTTIDVTPGECFTLCSGCAYCCFAFQTSPGGPGCRSYVCKSGEFCLIAHGSAPSCYQEWNCDISRDINVCCLPDPCNAGNNRCSANSCSGWNFCWDAAADEAYVGHAFSRCSWEVSGISGRNPETYGINGLWPAICVSSDHQDGRGYSISTPVFGFESCVCCESYDCNTCAGCCRRASQGILQIPGAGGYASKVYNSCNACGGDAGRMGMVCVSWECD